MKLIPLTQGRFASIDDDDYEKICRYKWWAQKQPNTFYAGRMITLEGGKRYPLMMHRVIMNESPNGLEVDHIDGNGLNNQKHNLRFVTRRQNMQNAVNSRIKVTSQYPGVSYDARRNKWKSYIKINGIHRDIGRFISEEEAFRAYKNAVESIGETVVERRLTP